MKNENQGGASNKDAILFLSGEQIKSIAQAQGFHACGIAKVGALDGTRLDKWLQQGFHAEMQYMEQNREKRLNPALLFPGTKTIVSVLLSYHSQSTEGGFRFARYAMGEDYHTVMKQKLWNMTAELQAIKPDLQAIPFVDSAPVMDREWAQRAGLGWIGKNGCLIHKRMGSMVFIGELLLNTATEYDTPEANHCGHCRRCIDACPNAAIQEHGSLNSNRCISYHTIENKGKIPEEIKTERWIYGCDICQEVCPWNNMKHAYPIEERFKPSIELVSLLNTGEITKIERSTFKKLFKKTAVSRVKYEKFMDNIVHANKNNSDTDSV